MRNQKAVGEIMVCLKHVFGTPVFRPAWAKNTGLKTGAPIAVFP
jgi:hypothetical protein